MLTNLFRLLLNCNAIKPLYIHRKREFHWSNYAQSSLYVVHNVNCQFDIPVWGLRKRERERPSCFTSRHAQCRESALTDHVACLSCSTDSCNTRIHGLSTVATGRWKMARYLRPPNTSLFVRNIADESRYVVTFNPAGVQAGMVRLNVTLVS